MRLISYKTALWATIILVVFMSVWKKDRLDLQEWDESRNGVNAYEMLINKDFVNFYYNGQLDTWNVKPPLMVWSIAVSYLVFGFNEFALRFPTTVCTIIFLALSFFMIKKFADEKIALLSIVILLACKAVFGFHTGLTGDFDMMLTMFLTASVFCFLLYIEEDKKNMIILSAVFLGLAFYTKGPAALILLPGLFLYTLWRRPKTMREPMFWLSLFIFIVIASSWLFILSRFGKSAESSYYGSKNSLEVMFLHDTFRRITSENFDNSGTSARDLAFFFKVLDTKFNLWNYILYLAIGLALFYAYKRKDTLRTIVTNPKNRFLILSICLTLPISVLLTFSHTAHHWYMAPVFIFIAFLLAKAAVFLWHMGKGFQIVIICLLVFTLARQTWFITTLSTRAHHSVGDNAALRDQKILAATYIKQDLLLYLKWQNSEVKQVDPQYIPQSGDLMLLSDQQVSDYAGKLTIVQEIDGYCFVSFR